MAFSVFATTEDTSFTRLALFALPAFFVLKCLAKYLNGLRATKYISGVRCGFGPLSFYGAVFGTRWWNPGLDFWWYRRMDLYKTYGSDTISIVPIVGGKAHFLTANLEVAKQVIAGGVKSDFYKSEGLNKALLLWGQNVAASEGEHWKRHRRIANPAFSPSTYALVWRETVRTYTDMMKTEGWASQEEVFIPVLQGYLFKFAFFVIAACGFGLPFAWQDPPRSTQGFSIQESLRIVLNHSFLQVVLPKWIFDLPRTIQTRTIKDVKIARETLDAFMREQIAVKKEEIRRGKLGLEEESGEEREGVDGSYKAGMKGLDVFTRLTRANEEESESGLTDDELIGNVFVMLFAGHETTANTLSTVMSYLAIHQEVQEEVYQQIIQVCGDREPVFEDYPKLDKVLACFLEALRMIPAGSIMIREAKQDTTLVVPSVNGIERVEHIALKEGSMIMVDVIGLQYNPRYFPEPNEYRPSRWYVTPENPKPLEAFTAFSFGPRVCIGQNFSKTEGVAYIAMLLRDWKLDVKLRAGETRKQYMDRVMQAKFLMTLTATDIPVVLKRRNGF